MQCRTVMKDMLQDPRGSGNEKLARAAGARLYIPQQTLLTRAQTFASAVFKSGSDSGIIPREPTFQRTILRSSLSSLIMPISRHTL